MVLMVFITVCFGVHHGFFHAHRCFVMSIKVLFMSITVLLVFITVLMVSIADLLVFITVLLVFITILMGVHNGFVWLTVPLPSISAFVFDIFSSCLTRVSWRDCEYFCFHLLFAV